MTAVRRPAGRSRSTPSRARTAVEPWPWAFADEGAQHYRTLSLLGLPLGEQFVLDELAADCADDGRYEFMMVSVPTFEVRMMMGMLRVAGICRS